MSKVYEVEYEVDVKSEVVKKKDEIVRNAGRFWEHAVENPVFKYDLPVGDAKKAKAVASVLRILNGKVQLQKKKLVIKEVS